MNSKFYTERFLLSSLSYLRGQRAGFQVPSRGFRGFLLVRQSMRRAENKNASVTTLIKEQTPPKKQEKC